MIRLLVRIRIRLILSSLFGKKKKTGGIALTVFGLIMYLLFINAITASTVGLAAVILKESNQEWLIISLAMGVAFFLCFLGSVFMAQQQIYESKDNEMLMSMPIKPGQIVLSRIFAIAVFNLIYALPFFTGTVLGHSLALNSIEVIPIIILLLCYIAMVVFVTMLTSLLAWGVSIVLSKITNKTIISTVLYLIFFAIYFYSIFNLDNVGETIEKNADKISSGIMTFARPLYYMGESFTQQNILFALVFIATMLIPAFLIYLVLKKSFFKILLHENKTKKTKYKGGDYKSRPIFVALLQKEIARFLKTPMYFMSYGTSIFFVAMMLIYLFIKKDKLEDVVNVLSIYGVSSTKALPAIFSMLLYQFVSTGALLTSASINMEGKNIWIIKSLPIRTIDILVAKGLVPVVTLLPVFEIESILFILLFNIKGTGIIIMLLMPIFTMTFFSMFGIYINLKHFKLDWISENEAFKRAGGPTIASFSSLGITALFAILYFLIFGNFMGFFAYMWFMLASLAIGSVIIYSMLKNNADELLLKVN